VLLGIKALTLKNMREKEMIGPTEIADISKINLSTVKNCLRELEKEKIAISEKGKYMIPNFLLPFLKERFENLKEMKVEKKVLKRKIERKRRGKGPTIDTSKLEKIFKLPPQEFAGEFYNFLIEKQGKYLEKALIVLKQAKERCKIDGLTAGEITKILQEHLRVPKIHHPNITTALGSKTASKYIFKQPTKNKKVYLYKLTKPGEDFVNEINPQLKEK
jgi:DNA-binding transcriptional regulator YhcF (GntR family)